MLIPINVQAVVNIEMKFTRDGSGCGMRGKYER
jgi:hypothetical protein